MEAAMAVEVMAATSTAAEEVAAEDGSDDGVGISADLDKAAAAVVWRRQLLLGQQRPARMRKTPALAAGGTQARPAYKTE